MKYLRPLLAAFLAALLAAPALAQTEPEARVIVRFKPQADSVRAKALSLRATRSEAREVAQTRATALGLRTGQALLAGRSLDERTHVVISRGMTAAQLARRLAADPEVELVAVDRLRKHMEAAPNDPLFNGPTPAPTSFIGRFPDEFGTLQDTYSRTIDQWYLKAPSTVATGGSATGEVVSSVNVLSAWDLTHGQPSVVAAVLDTGVRSDHPDLAGQFLPGYDMIGLSSPGSQSTAIANDGDGADADPSDPGDWVNQADIDSKALGSGCTASDIGNSSWHGTRVSGLIAAVRNNGAGISGVAPGVRLLPVRVLGKCGGYDSDIIAGMKWAVGLAVPGLPANTNKAKVLNLSLGGSGSCSSTDSTGSLYRDAIAQVNATGATIVVAAGNSEGQAVGLPGNCPGVVAVAALRHVGTKVGFSSVGPEVTVAAPGGNCVNLAVGFPCLYTMVSTTNGGTTSPILNDASYTGGNPSVGTSFSAPIVSGIVGLMASVRPALTSAEATPILKLTARRFPTSGGTAGVTACQAPNSSIKQDECYCTTSTCGAGMVDAFAAVKAAQALNSATVAVTPSSTSLTAAQSATLTASITGLAAGKTVTATKWTLIDKGNGVVSAFGSGADTATVSLTPAAEGNFAVQADVTDSDGYVHSQTASFAVAAAAVTPAASTSGGGNGGGGGAASAAWLAALLLAGLALRPSARFSPTRRPRRLRPAPPARRCRP